MVGKRCNTVVMKCLLSQERMETKDIFYKQEDFLENTELKMARNRKVMKVKTREGSERRGCNSNAANKKTQHV